MTNKKGFTLIELLIVIAIIGILATLAVVAFTGVQQRSRDSKRVADIRAVVSAFASASQDGMYICIAGACGTAPANNTTYLVSDLRICDAPCSGTSNDKTSTYINLGTTKDPSKSGTKCTFTGSPTIPSAACDYTLEGAATAPTISNFNIGFWLEGAVQGLTAGGHKANAVGIAN